jgi:VWFA-related protein
MWMVLLFIGLLCPCAAHAQQTSSPPPAAQQDGGDQSVSTLQVNVNVVNLFFNVKDKHGTLIPNLAQNDFQVFEDGRPQTIKYFASESDQPLTLGILIDSSVSQERVLPMEKEVGAAFLKQVLRPKDEAFVISFDVNVDLLQDFTNSTSMLRTALNEAKINGGGGCGGIPGIGQGPIPCGNPKGTLLYDAVYLAGREKLATEVGRKAMIILTDGEDQGSQETIRQAIEAAQKSDSICYVLLIADRGFYGLGGYSGDRAMKELAQETGGRVIEVGNKPEKLKQAFDQIANELRTQYSIGYTPTNTKRDGSFRRVQVKTKEGYKVQCRSGYYALPPRGEGE